MDKEAGRTLLHSPLNIFSGDLYSLILLVCTINQKMTRVYKQKTVLTKFR